MQLTRRGFVALAASGALAGLTGCTGAAGAAAGGSSAGSAAGTSSGAEKVGQGKLRVGVRSDIMGFGYLNKKTKKYYGMEIDLADDLASRLGYEGTEFSTITPENRKQMLLDHKIDCIIGCYSIAESRKKNFDFSPSYYTNSVIMVVQNSSLTADMSGLKGGTIGTMAGANTAPMLAQELTKDGFSDGQVRSTNEDNSDVQFDTYRLLQFPSYQDLSDALEEGTVDAMAMDGAIAKTYMDDKRAILPDFSINPQEYGIATNKGSALTKPIAKAVQEMLDDGTIDKLIDKWD